MRIYTKSLEMHPDFPKLAIAIKSNNVAAATDLLQNFSLLDPGFLSIFLEQELNGDSINTDNLIDLKNVGSKWDAYLNDLSHVKSPQMVQVLLSAGLPISHLVLAVTRRPKTHMIFAMGMILHLLSPSPTDYKNFDLNVPTCSISLDQMHVPLLYGNISYDLVQMFSACKDNINIGYDNSPIMKNLENIEIDIRTIQKTMQELAKNSKAEIIEFDLKEVNEFLDNYPLIKAENFKLINSLSLTQSYDQSKTLVENIDEALIQKFSLIKYESNKYVLYSICSTVVGHMLGVLLNSSYSKLNSDATEYSRTCMTVGLILLYSLGYIMFNKTIDQVDNYMKKEEDINAIEPFKLSKGIALLIRTISDANTPQVIEKLIVDTKKARAMCNQSEEMHTAANMLKNMHGHDFANDRLTLWTNVKSRFYNDWHTPRPPKSLTWWKQVLDTAEPSVVEEGQKPNNRTAFRFV